MYANILLRLVLKDISNHRNALRNAMFGFKWFHNAAQDTEMPSEMQHLALDGLGM